MYRAALFLGSRYYFEAFRRHTSSHVSLSLLLPLHMLRLVPVAELSRICSSLALVLAVKAYAITFAAHPRRISRSLATFPEASPLRSDEGGMASTAVFGPIVLLAGACGRRKMSVCQHPDDRKSM